MEIDVLKFLEDNWQNIIITLAAGVIFYFLSNYAQKKYFASAEKERLKQAKDSLLDILEARIINKQEIYLDKIKILLKAIERDHSVNLSDVVSPLSLLEDLELKFEKSHHLDPSQKEVYCREIQNGIQNIRATEEALTVPRKYSEILDALEKDIDSKNTDNALKNLLLLKKKINEREEYIYTMPESKISTIIISIVMVYVLFTLLKAISTSIVLIGFIVVMAGLAVIIIRKN